MGDITIRFGVIEDPRHSGYVRHKLEHILTIVMRAVLCGMDKLDEIVAYQKNNQENLGSVCKIKLAQKGGEG